MGAYVRRAYSLWVPHTLWDILLNETLFFHDSGYRVNGQFVMT